MRDDLLEAKAAVDWAESDFPNLAGRLTDWEKGHPFTIFRDVDSKPGKHIFRLHNVKPIPLILGSHAGAVIHSIRCSLDILAVALAERNRHPRPEDVYFPIANSEVAFRKGSRKKINGLAARDIAIIESLKPWKGGNDLLFELHNLDKIRKHQRLLSAYGAPAMIAVPPELLRGGLKIVSAWPGLQEDAVIGEMPAGTAQGYPHLSVQIRLAEGGTVSTVGLLEALQQFANLAQLIIKRFDRP